MYMFTAITVFSIIFVFLCLASYSYFTIIYYLKLFCIVLVSVVSVSAMACNV